MPLSWANVVRRATGEKLVDVNGELLTKTVAFVRARKFNIMDLPSEIRTIVLSFVLSEEPKTIMVFPKDTPLNRAHRRPIPLPALTRAGDRQLRLETIKHFLEHTVIEIHSGPANEQICTYLNKLDFSFLGSDTNYSIGLGAVKQLSFPYFSRYPHAKLAADAPNNDVELAMSCRDLRTLKLTFVDAELCTQANDILIPKTVDRLRREYRLDGLLGLGMLEEVKFGIVETNFVYSWAGLVCKTVLTKLADWFHEQLEAKGRKREIEMVIV